MNPLLIHDGFTLTLLLRIIQTTSVILLLYTVSLAIYRLYLSPISHIPGPKLAALTFFYEFYYDALCDGRYLWKVKSLHEQYGPIVRINPREVHIADASFYDTIYASDPKNHPRNKIRFMATQDQSMFDSYLSDVHRRRRAALAPCFSKQSIKALEPLILSTIQQLCGRISSSSSSSSSSSALDSSSSSSNNNNNKNQQPVLNLKELYSGLTMDVIAQYCFGESMNNLTQESFGKEYADFFHEMPRGHPIGRMFPWLFDLIQKIPLSVLAKLDPKLKPLADYDAKISGQIRSVLSKDKPERDGMKRTVFHEMRDSKVLSEGDKSLERFKSEAVVFLGAGTETTASALTVISFWLVEGGGWRLKRLREELKGVLEGGMEGMTVARLEGLPYLTGVIQEGIRLSFGVPGRLPRYAPIEDLAYKGYKLPRGTILSSSSYLLHTNPKDFPDPHEFVPERWMTTEPGLKTAGPHKSFVPFSRGTRQCIGINLAYAELYLTVAAVFSTFDFELVETTRRDVTLTHDFFVGMPPLDSKGVRARVVRDLESAN